MTLARMLALASVVLLTACEVRNDDGNSAEAGADLTTRRDDVYHQSSDGSRESVPRDDQRDVNQGDTVNVDGPGEGRLDFADGLIVSIFRDSALRIEGYADEMSPIDRVRLNGGTLYADVSGATGYANQRVVITAGGAVITALGTEFLVHYNPTLVLTWVIVTDGEVLVEAGGVARVVPAGWQIWVQRGPPMLSAPYPATRAIADWAYQRVALPLLEDLGGPTLRDSAMLDSPQCSVDSSPDAQLSLRAAPRNDAAAVAVVRDGVPFEAVARSSEAAWVKDVAERWAQVTQLDCPYAILELPVRSGPTPPTLVPPTPMPRNGGDAPTTAPRAPTAEPTLPDTTPPPAPEPLSPVNGEELSCAGTVDLTWNPVMDESGISTYRWSLAVSENGQDGPYSGGVTGDTTQTSVTPSIPTCGKWYEWQVMAIDGANNESAISATFRFYIDFEVGDDVE